MSAKDDAPLGLPVQYAMDMYTGSGGRSLEPAADPRLAPKWALRGYLTALDTVFRQGVLNAGQRVFYGFLAEATDSPGEFIVIVRGTNGVIEWIEDAEFELMAHPGGAGNVEAGFFGIYATLEMAGASAALALANAVGKGSVTVVGHSLGAAIATYLAFDLAGILGARVRARLFASPHPGDATFAQAFAQRVGDHIAYAYEFDVVPKVPLWLGYCGLPNLVHIGPTSAQARVKLDVFCNHHIICYAAMMDYDLADWTAFDAKSVSCETCIRGRASG